VIGAADRKRFAELLPVLLENLRDGVASIGWSGPQLRDFVEHLRAAHAAALAAGEAPQPPAGETLSASMVRIRLDGLRVETLPAAPRLRPVAVLEEAVHHRLDASGAGVMHRRVQIEGAPEPTALDAAAAEQLIERWQPGTWFDLRIGRAAVRVRLEGLTATRSLALFSTSPGPELYSLSHASLMVYVRNAWMTPVEVVPLVARAFRTVLADLRRAAKAADGGGHAA